MEIETIEDIVKTILKNAPLTRGSDTLLYKNVCEYLAPEIKQMSFGFVLANRRELGLPKFESVSRARRFVQAENEALMPPEGVTDRRYENWKEVRKCALEHRERASIMLTK